MITKKGSRTLVVDGHSYRWMIRSRPTYAQALGEFPLRFAVELEGGASILVVSVDSPRPENWLKLPRKSVTPDARPCGSSHPASSRHRMEADRTRLGL